MHAPFGGMWLPSGWPDFPFTLKRQPAHNAQRECGGDFNDQERNRRRGEADRAENFQVTFKSVGTDKNEDLVASIIWDVKGRDKRLCRP